MTGLADAGKTGVPRVSADDIGTGSPISQSAGCRNSAAFAGLETRDTADLEVCGTGLPMKYPGLSLSENSEGCCFRAKSWKARRDESASAEALARQGRIPFMGLRPRSHEASRLFARKPFRRRQSHGGTSRAAGLLPAGRVGSVVTVPYGDPPSPRLRWTGAPPSPPCPQPKSPAAARF